MTYQRRYSPSSIPASQPTSKISSNGKHKAPWLLIAGLVLALIGIIGGILWFVQFKSNREPQITTIPDFKRDALATASAINAEKIFSDESIRRFNNGDGLKTRFVISFHGKEEWVRPFELPMKKMTAETNRPARREDVLKKISEFQETATEFSRYQPRTWTVEVMVDDSDGVDEKLQRQVIGEMDDLELTNRMKAGDGVNFWTFRLSATDYLDDSHTAVAQGEGTHGYGKIARKLDEIIKPRGATKATSLATGLFNALAKNSGKPNRTVLIFSDGLENSAMADFYKNPPTKEAEWKELGEKFQTKVQRPDLKGVWIYWYGPKSGANADQIRASLKFWRHLLEEAGAHIEIEY